MRRELLNEFRRLGFTVYDGPEWSWTITIFSALNFKDDHPARDMQDTFFIKGRPGMIMRTHTSNIQVQCDAASDQPLSMVALVVPTGCDSGLDPHAHVSPDRVFLGG